LIHLNVQDQLETVGWLFFVCQATSNAHSWSRLIKDSQSLIKQMVDYMVNHFITEWKSMMPLCTERYIVSTSKCKATYIRRTTSFLFCQ